MRSCRHAYTLFIGSNKTQSLTNLNVNRIRKTPIIHKRCIQWTGGMLHGEHTPYAQWIGNLSSDWHGIYTLVETEWNRNPLSRANLKVGRGCALWHSRRGSEMGTIPCIGGRCLQSRMPETWPGQETHRAAAPKVYNNSTPHSCDTKRADQTA